MFSAVLNYFQVINGHVSMATVWHAGKIWNASCHYHWKLIKVVSDGGKSGGVEVKSSPLFICFYPPANCWIPAFSLNWTNTFLTVCVHACTCVCVWVREGVRCREKAYVQMNSIIRLSCRPLVDGCRNRISPSPSAGMSLLTAAIIFPASVYMFLLIISGFFGFSKGLKVFPLLKAMLSFVSISMSVLISPSLKARSPIV